MLTFRAVAHRRSFSHAARDLALSQPAVSNQVAQLERELGVPLLSRGPGGLELTAEGRIVLEHADVIEGPEHRRRSYTDRRDREDTSPVAQHLRG